VTELQDLSADNPHIELSLTRFGGHVGYISGHKGQQLSGDSDRWWALNRLLDWFNQQSATLQTVSARPLTVF
jgi:predicted alpha/beta-fold hydrolase